MEQAFKDLMAALEPHVIELASGAAAVVAAAILSAFKRVRQAVGRLFRLSGGPPAAVVLILALALSACGTIGGAGSGLFNEQDQAGLTDWHLEFNDQGQLREVRVIDGKEKQNVRLQADIKAGTVDYSATNVKAFGAFETRADVEKWVASRWPEVVPEVRSGITDIIGFLTGL